MECRMWYSAIYDRERGSALIGPPLRSKGIGCINKVWSNNTLLSRGVVPLALFILSLSLYAIWWYRQNGTIVRFLFQVPEWESKFPLLSLSSQQRFPQLGVDSMMEWQKPVARNAYVNRRNKRNPFSLSLCSYVCEATKRQTGKWRKRRQQLISSARSACVYCFLQHFHNDSYSAVTGRSPLCCICRSKSLYVAHVK